MRIEQRKLRRRDMYGRFLAGYVGAITLPSLLLDRNLFVENWIGVLSVVLGAAAIFIVDWYSAVDLGTQEEWLQRTAKHVAEQTTEDLVRTIGDRFNTELSAAYQRNRELEQENVLLSGALDRAEVALRPFASYPLYVNDEPENAKWVPGLMPEHWIGGGFHYGEDYSLAKTTVDGVRATRAKIYEIKR